ncbi:MAG: CPBP family intramembrane metalloprotease [Lachnospiraceae bacterium]|nr:CPBP family intramembrane metalloprotease [Lachnospiraceae bacterium]
MKDFSEQEEQDGELFRVVRRRAVVGAVLVFAGVFLVQFIAYMVTMLLIPVFVQFASGKGESPEVSGLLTDDKYRRLVSEWFSLIASMIYILWCGSLYRRSDLRQEPDYREVFGKRHILQILLIGFCGCFFAIVVLTILQNIFPDFFAEYQKNMGDFNTGSARMFLYTLLLGPVAEELIFRGVLFDRLYLAFPFWVANLLQAFLFGVYHGNLIQGTYAFLFGLLLGMMHQTGGSIWNNILTHILFNLTNFIVPILYGLVAVKNGNFLVTLVLLCFFGFCYGLHLLYREVTEKI